MLIVASMGETDRAWMLLYMLPLVLPMPFVMLWLAVRAFRRSEGQSVRVIVGMALMMMIAGLYLYPFQLPRLGRSAGFLTHG